jgi:hypothetical protein
MGVVVIYSLKDSETNGIFSSIPFGRLSCMAPLGPENV